MKHLLLKHLGCALQSTVVAVLFALVTGELSDTNWRFDISKIGNATGNETLMSASDVAKGFTYHIKKLQTGKGTSVTRHTIHYNPDRRQLEEYYIHDDDVEVITEEPLSVKASLVHPQKYELNRKSDVKATDYILTSPRSSRRGKSSKHYSDGMRHYQDDAPVPERKTLTISEAVVVPSVILTQPLHSRNNPQVPFEVISSKVMFVFQVSAEENERSYISITVEKMSCQESANMTDLPRIHIRGESQELSFCKEVDNSKNHYQAVEYVTSGDKMVSIWGTGDDWTNTSVSLVASIYTETNSCNHCPATHFCCGRKETACMASNKIRESSKYLNVEHKGSINSQQQRYRCIPKQDQKGKSLLCNGHPNCGFFCNADELSLHCPKDDVDEPNGDSNCVGNYCRESEKDRFMITFLLLILFCVFVPCCVFLFCCSRKELRRELGRARGRCPVPLELAICPFGVSTEDSTTTPASSTGRRLSPLQEVESRMRGNARRGRPETGIIDRGVMPTAIENPGFFDDLPPPYSQVCNDKVTFPNPCLTNNTGSSVERLGTLFVMETINSPVMPGSRRNGMGNINASGSLPTITRNPGTGTANTNM